MAARRVVAHLVVAPRIIARFTATRMAGGFRDIVAQGRFAPAGSAQVELVWQARAPSGPWQLVGGLSSRIRPGHNGRFRGRLELTLRDGIQLRLIYLPGAVAPFSGAASKAAAPTLAAHAH